MTTQNTLFPFIDLVDLDADLVDAWRHHFSDCARVHATRSDLLSRGACAIVSPANSFGFMDGGLDLVISERLGWEIERKVRERILDEHDGELPVGQAFVVETERDDFPYLVCAPTMRVPMNVSTTFNAYLAFRAVLRAVRDHNASSSAPIRTLRCPGLGTGNGRIPPDACARQMRRAYEAIVHGYVVRKGGLAAVARDHLMMMDVPFCE